MFVPARERFLLPCVGALHYRFQEVVLLPIDRQSKRSNGAFIVWRKTAKKRMVAVAYRSYQASPGYLAAAIAANRDARRG